ICQQRLVLDFGISRNSDNRRSAVGQEESGHGQIDGSIDSGWGVEGSGNRSPQRMMAPNRPGYARARHRPKSRVVVVLQFCSDSQRDSVGKQRDLVLDEGTVQTGVAVRRVQRDAQTSSGCRARIAITHSPDKIVARPRGKSMLKVDAE